MTAPDFKPVVTSGIMRIPSLKMTWVICATLLAATAASPQTFSTVHSFDGTDGANPWGGLVQTGNGELYGATALGGINDTCAGGYGCGTAFKMTTRGSVSTLHDFCSESGCLFPHHRANPG
jgi:uncharacterized repeat protein (TIGR03803 family)